MRVLAFGMCLLLTASGCRRADTAREWEEKLLSSEPEVRARAAREIGKRGANAVASVETLAAMLRSSDPDERQSAATALGKIGGPAKSTVPELIEALADPAWPVRRAAALALGDIGDAQALDALTRLQSDRDSLVRKAASESAAKLRK